MNLPNPEMHDADIVTFGEAMIRLTPPHFKRLQQTDQFDVEIGGSELNTAVALAHLGRKVTWVSRLPDHAIGQLIVNRVRETGVQTDHILRCEGGRVGIYYLEQGAAPRPSSILYDRQNSSIAQIQPGMIPWDTIFAQAKWFHVTGITPAISKSSFAVTTEALQKAKDHGLQISMEVNFRSKLWSFQEAGDWLRSHLPLATVLITNPDELESFFGLSKTDLEQSANQLRTQYHLRAIAITLRDTLSIWKNRFSAVALDDSGFYTSKKYEVEIVDRLGTGDSFDAGLIHGLLNNSLKQGLDWGVALAAYKHSIPGDLSWFEPSEIETLIHQEGLRIQR